jgi:gamma-glutamyltranspeptidase/glutathione hydrolase
MPKTATAVRGMVVSPHNLASEAGLAVLRAGGNAVEASIATSAALCVVYPHMNGLGGDGFWTIHDPAAKTIHCIDASGLAGKKVSLSLLEQKGVAQIPTHGTAAMLTCPGAVAGWQKALELAAVLSGPRYKPLPLECLFEDACYYAENGFPISGSQIETLTANLESLKNQPGFAEQFLSAQDADRIVPEINSRQTLPALGQTFKRLGRDGLDSFYRGQLAVDIAATLQKLGSVLTLEDLQAQEAALVQPLHTQIQAKRGFVRLYNCPPPSQGIASLLILALYAALQKQDSLEEYTSHHWIHRLVECTKIAFKLRAEHLADPAHMKINALEWLSPAQLQKLSSTIDLCNASGWKSGGSNGDTVWFGVIDQQGLATSVIQSIYFGFGSGVVLPDLGITWHNRSLGFSLIPGHPNVLGPRKRPFHTLNPALAVFGDGRVMPYGCMGGEGQPQTQAAVFCRYALQEADLQESIRAPRWLLGRSWGATSSSLKLEADFPQEVIKALQAAGHNIEIVPPNNELMGHAGALVKHANGLIAGAADPRGDGLAAGW